MYKGFIKLPKRLCSVEGCKKPYCQHGYCSMHWARVKRGTTDMRPEKLPTLVITENQLAIIKDRRRRESKIANNKKLEARKEVLNHYGSICACCGENNVRFLTVDHTNNDGAEHRKKIKKDIVYWLIKNNYPEGFQVLCFNCNLGKSLNKGICPHKEA